MKPQSPAAGAAGLVFGKGGNDVIRKADRKDAKQTAALAVRLWPSHTVDEMEAEFSEMLADETCAVFLSERDGEANGFAQCQLRHDYVEGTETSPVGYLEGIFVDAPYRNRGVARALLNACEDWARQQRCTEFASDCELTNEQSLRFHLAAGFAEANRIICFTKKL